MKTKRILMVFFVLISFYDLKAQTSNCYEIKQTVSLTGYVNTQSYPVAMFDTICNLVKKVDQIDNNNTQFKIFSYDLYPIMAYVNPMDGLEYQVSQIKEELKNMTEVAAVFKLFDLGTLKYDFFLKLPNTGKFQNINELQVAGIESSISGTMNFASNTHFFMIFSEILGFQQFKKYIDDIDNGTLAIAQFEDNGFEKMVSNVYDTKLTRTGIKSEASSGKIRVIDYNGYKYDNTSYANLILGTENSFQSLDFLYIISGKENTSIINEIKATFDESKAKIKIWLHLDFNLVSNPPPSTEYVSWLKTENNLTTDEASALVNSLYQEKNEQWTKNDLEEDPEEYDPEEDDNLDNDPVAMVAPSSGDCGGSFQWGKNCILPNVEGFVGSVFGLSYIEPKFMLLHAKFMAAAIAGFIDGLLGTIETVYTASAGIWETLKNSTIAKGIALSVISLPFGIAYAVVNWEAMSKELSKTVNYAKKFLKGAWETVKSVYETTKTFLQNASWSSLKNVANAIKEALDGWIGSEFGGSYSNFLGYSTGLIAFEVLAAYFTAGLATGAKAGSMTFKFIDIIKKFNDPTGLKNLLLNILNSANSSVAKAKKFACKVLKLRCFVKDTPVLMANNPFKVPVGAYALAAAPFIAAPIQNVQLLDYAVTNETVNSDYGQVCSSDTYMGLFNKDIYTSDQQRERDRFELNNEDWNEVVFEEIEGSSVAKLALHKAWIEKNGYELNAVVPLYLPEQGISGPFKITSIKHILPQKKPVDDYLSDDYSYRPVTALISHTSDQVLNITFDNVETIGVTSLHPIYSVTADDWRLAGELEVGEKVLAYQGEATVTKKEKKSGSEAVYNLEIKDLHNFLVGDVGVVVHNNYKWILDLIDFPFEQVKLKMKHAPDFGFSSNQNTANVNNFIKHLEGFVSDNKGKKYLTKVNYHGQHKDAMVVLDEVSRLMVVTKGDGEFITAYKMSVEQVTQLLNDKFIW
jgi:hypothetical protein